MTPSDPLRLRQTFDGVAERYDRVRPGYPAVLFDDLAALGGLAAGSRVLEIGGGTGLATVPLAQRGYWVVALELGKELAAVARRRLAAYANVEVVVATSRHPDCSTASCGGDTTGNTTTRPMKFRDLLQTFSNVLVLDQVQQAGLLACIGGLVDRELGGRISERIANQLLIARRPSDTR